MAARHRQRPADRRRLPHRSRAGATASRASASHGAGHKLCSDAFYEAVKPLDRFVQIDLPRCCDGELRCGNDDGPEVMEACFWEALGVVRKALEESPEMVGTLAGRLRASRERLDAAGRAPRAGAPQVEKVYELAGDGRTPVPAELALEPGTKTTLRGELGRVLNEYNKASHGAFLAAAADLLGSTSVNVVGDGFPGGWYHTGTNPESRLFASGGICEDAMIGILAGLSTIGRHIGAGSSYGAFLAPLGHIPARLHCIGNMAAREAFGEDYRPLFLVCAHAGLKTGEDGPTHADPQALQLLQENFPDETMLTLTPWDPAEMWPLVTAALARRPAVIAPFVTRPTETIPDRAALGLAPAADCATGVYKLRSAEGEADGSLVLQGSGETFAFVEGALPRLIQDGVNLDIYYVASAELFDTLPEEERRAIFPTSAAETAMAITGFTLPTIYRWIRSDLGRSLSLHPFQKGHFLGSGQAHMVLAEAGMDGESQYHAVRRYLDARASAK
jgi:transketolase